MICIQPDVIEKMPNSCADCVFAYYDEAHGDSFYCGISRFTVNKERKHKTRHKGCGIFDPNYGIEDGQEIEDKKNEIKEQKVRTYEDIIGEAKAIRDSLSDHGLDVDELDDVDEIGLDIEDSDTVSGEEEEE